MEDEQPENLKKRGNAKSATSGNVAARVHALRDKMDLKTLSERLSAIGWPISVAALSRLENGQRRIDVDDLVALSVALEVPPIELLFADTDERPAGTGISERFSVDDAKAWSKGAARLSPVSMMGYWTRIYYESGIQFESSSQTLHRADVSEWEREEAHRKVDDAITRLHLAWSRLKDLQSAFVAPTPLPTVGGMPDIRDRELSPGQIPPPFATLGN